MARYLGVYSKLLKMNETIECEVVMLPNKSAQTCLGLIKCIKDWTSSCFPDEDKNKKGDISFGKNVSKGVFEYWRPQHLHLTSNEEVKEGEPYYDFFYNTVNICNDVLAANVKAQGMVNLEIAKVVATTDTSFCLPIIPEMAVKKYADKNIIAEKVLLLRSSHGYYDSKEKWCWQPLLSGNNEVVVIRWIYPASLAQEQATKIYGK